MCAILMRPEGHTHENCLQALLPLCLAEHSRSHQGEILSVLLVLVPSSHTAAGLHSVTWGRGT